jgi:hypothetical protein
MAHPSIRFPCLYDSGFLARAREGRNGVKNNFSTPEIPVVSSHSFMAWGVAAKALGISIYTPELKPTDYFDTSKRHWVSYPFKMLSLDGFGLQNPPIDLAITDTCADVKLLGHGWPPGEHDARIICQKDITVELAELKHFHLTLRSARTSSISPRRMRIDSEKEQQ